MTIQIDEFEATWDAFLKEWPLKRLREMELQEYSDAGDSHTFTAWIESRLDKLGSIWGGSAFKFGIYSRKDKTKKASTSTDSYSADYAWYTKYGDTPRKAFAKVKGLVVQVAEAAARGDYSAIDAIDLGDAYKWKIAFHYQDRANPGVVAVFKTKRLKAWLKGKIGNIPSESSALYREILKLSPGKKLATLSEEVWQETADDPAAESNASLQVVSDDEVLAGHFAPKIPLNLVLYGPPGTGKTFATAELAVRACDGVIPDGRRALMTRYRELRDLRRIRFVTFHPSFTYEEFVEGIRPSTTDDGRVRYAVRPGVLKHAVQRARELFELRTTSPSEDIIEGHRVFKMSLGDSTKSEDDGIFPECVENGFVCLGFAHGIDFRGLNTLQKVRERFQKAHPQAKDSDFSITAVHYLKNEMQVGDIVLISDGNTRFRGIAEITGEYYYFDQDDARYAQRRPVRWLWTSTESLPVDLVCSKRFSQQSIYLMDQNALKRSALQALVVPTRSGDGAINCVLIIDEINRANLAKTFGELITLLEPSKRLGGVDEQLAELPYSGEMFGVPPNLYVIGTMNTADRSIALMDTALRRRFSFREMVPRVDLLSTDVDGINLQALLTSINVRIEELFDRDHVLGHTYLMNVESYEELVLRFVDQIIPLMKEYFFDDWRKIQQVFRDEREPSDRQIIQDLHQPDGTTTDRDRRMRFAVNPNIPPAAIQKIYA